MDSKLSALKCELSKIKEDKEELVLELASVSRRRCTRAQAEEVQSEMESIQSTLNNLCIAEKCLEDAISTKEGFDGQQSQAPLSKKQNAKSDMNQHPSYALPASLPSFRTGNHNTENDPGIFIERFTRVLKAHGIPEEQWKPIMPAYCFEACANWLENLMLNKDLSWTEIKALFMEHYQHSVSQQRHLINLLTIRMKRGESISEFSDRFCYLMRLAKSEDSDPKLIEQYWLCLPSEIRSDVASTRLHSPVHNIHDIIRHALMHSSARYDSHSETNNEVTWKESTEKHMSTSYRQSFGYKENKRCHICSKPGHRANNCRWNQSKLRSNNSSILKNYDKKANNDRNLEMNCYRCGKPGHISTQCSEKGVKPSPLSVKAATIQEDEHMATIEPPESTAHDFFEISKNLTVMTVSKQDAKKVHHADNFQIPIKLNGMPFMAHIDTGARQSFLSPMVMNELNLEIVPKLGIIHLAASESSVSRRGISPEITVQCGSKEKRYSFEIMEILDSIPCLIGQDLFLSLGFVLSYPSYMNNITSNTSPDQGRCDNELPTMIDVDKSDDLEDIRERLLNFLEPVLQQNQAIKTGTFCNIPEAVVSLDTKNNPPSYIRQYPIPRHAEAVVEEKVKKWLQEGTIIPATAGSVWNSPLVVAPKKNSEGNKTDWRICLDPRAINRMLPDDKFPIPLVRDIFNKLAGAIIFTTLDLKDSYHQFPLKESDRHKTTFSWHNRQYMFAGCPFGLKPLSSIFQRIMSFLFSNDHFVLVFIDDIVVFSSSVEEHFHHVAHVIQKLTKANLLLRISKCFFAYSSVSLLGHIVSKTGISMDHKKIEQAQQWPQPRTGKDIERFLGLMNYFRDFIPRYSAIAAPLESLRKLKTLGPAWTDKCQEAFNSFKSLLFAAPILHYPDFSRTFYIATDASQTGVGACLYQMLNGKEQYIMFAAKALSVSERNYSATKRELLGIVFALKRFHYYIWGAKFTLFTDHRALSFLFTQKHLNPMMTTWLDTILNYNFDICHRPGILNVIPDTLSRLFPAFLREEGPDPPCSNDIICAGTGDTNTHVAPPIEERAELIQKAHLLGHFGEESMMKHLLSENYYWPSMRNQCREEILKCIPCQKFNVGKSGYHPLRPIHASLPWDHVAVDLAGPFPKTEGECAYLLIMICICTRFVILRPLIDKSGKSIAAELLKVFSLFGFPRIIQSDNGTEFVNHLVKEIVNSSGMDARLITPYHPRANGVAERTVQTSVRAIKKLLNGDFASWSFYVPAVQLAMNVKVASIHGSTPFSLMFGRRFNLFKDHSRDNHKPWSTEQLLAHHKHLTEVIYPGISDAVKVKQQKGIEQFAKTHKINNSSFPDGSYVMVKNSSPNEKFDPVFEGPFKIIRRNRGGAYLLQDMTGALLQRKFPPSAIKLISNNVANQEDVYEVETILNHRGSKSKREYLVRWKGYLPTHDSWEPEASFLDNDVVRKYWKMKEVSGKFRSGRG